MRIRTFPAAAAALALTVVACGGSAVTQPPASIVPTISRAPATSAAPATEAPASQAPASPSTDSESPGSSPARVTIVDNAFEPATVAVAAGAEVVWTHGGANTHTVTFADDGPESGNLSSGGTFRATFDEAGEFSYVCSIHSQMQGTVTVSE